MTDPISPGTLAKRMGCNAEHVRRAIREGRLGAVDISKTPGRPTWRIHKEQRHAWALGDPRIDMDIEGNLIP